MSKFSQTDLKYLEKLCRIQVDEELEKKLCSNMDKILDYMQKLQEIDTDGVEPLAHPIKEMSAPLRDDSQGLMIQTDEFLNNSPEHLGSMIKVPHIITEEAQDA